MCNVSRVISSLVFFSTFLSAGPISPLFVTHRGSVTVSVLQGDNVVDSWFMSNNGNQSAISVTDEVRIASHIGDGAAYSLDGTFLATIPNTPGNGADGATDGAFNYQFVGNALVRYTLDWLNPVVEFDFGVSSASWAGVTWDPTTDTFWVTSVNSLLGFVGNVDRHGNILSSFNTGAFGGEAGIAFDPADETLWIGNVLADRTFRQFSTTGTLLQTSTFDALAQTLRSRAGWSFKFRCKVVAGAAIHPCPNRDRGR